MISITNDDIIDAAVKIADRDGWSRVRMMHVASFLNIPIAEILIKFRDMDAIADAWFERTVLLIGSTPPEGFEAKSPSARLFDIMNSWFTAMECHRNVSIEMLSEKLYLSHPHHWGPLVFSLSRLVHTFLDLALINSYGQRRRAEELAITIIILSAIRVWSRDQSDHRSNTRKYLRKKLTQCDRIMSLLTRANTL